MTKNKNSSKISNHTAALKFTQKIAKLQRGCAPSAGFMEELILEARKALDLPEWINHY